MSELMYETDDELRAFFELLREYEVERPLGSGAFGKTLLVKDRGEHDLKVFKLPKDRQTERALVLEGENLLMLRGLRHPNIVELYRKGETSFCWRGRTEVRHYLILGFGGTSLRHILGPLRQEAGARQIRYFGSGKALAVPESLEIALEVCKGLQAAHSFRTEVATGILHRDIKPENILVDSEKRVRIADFGVSRVLEHSGGVVSMAGTGLYMDPFCARDEAARDSDLYSLAVMLYELLTGDLPFHTREELQAGRAPDVRQARPEVPRPLANILCKCLSQQRSDRFATAEELLAALTDVGRHANPLPARYRKSDDLGAGGYLGFDEQDRRRVLALVVENPSGLAELERCQQRLADLAQPALPAALSCFAHRGFIGMTYPSPAGQPLDQVLGGPPIRSPRRLEKLVALFQQLATTLHRAHRENLAHGLLSPRTVYADAQGHLAVYGMGLAGLVHRENAFPSSEDPLVEMLRFASPQYLKGNPPTSADDIYSLGVLLHYLLTATLPGPRQAPREVALAISTRTHIEAEASRELPEIWAEIVCRCLRVEPAARYPSMEELGADLGRTLAHLNPLPPGLEEVENRGSGRFLCRDLTRQEQVWLHVYPLQLDLAALASEAAELRQVAIPGLLAPERSFHHGHLTGVVYAPPAGKPWPETVAVPAAESLPACCREFARMARLVAAAHERGFVHGFLSPSLFFLGPADEAQLLGLAEKDAWRQLCQAQRLERSPLEGARPFLSPSLRQKTPATVADDGFALGAIFHYLLTGKHFLEPDALPDTLLPELRLRQANPGITLRLERVVGGLLNLPGLAALTVAEAAAQLQACTWPGDRVETLAAEAMSRYLRDQDLLAANTLLDEAFAIDPGSPHVYHARGWLYYQYGNHKFAREELEKALRVSPEARTYALLSRCCLEGTPADPMRALHLLALALAQGETAELHYLSARAFKALGRAREAEATLAQALAICRDPRQMAEYQLLAQSWRRP